MSNIQKAFKMKAKRGLCMAAGGFIDPAGTQSVLDRAEPPTGIDPGERAAGFSAMDHDPMADMNSLSPTPSASAANPFYGGRFGNDPHFSASTSRVVQAANLGGPHAAAAAPAATALPRRPVPNTLTPVDQLLPSRRGLQMADGGVVETPEQIMARMAQKYGTTGAAQAAPAVQAAPAPAPQPVQAPAPQPRGIINLLKTRGAQIDKAAGYAEGGTVVADGGRSKAPTADSVPVNLSHGEAVLPVKTVAALGGPGAVEHLIETTNGRPTATHGLRAGGRYSDGAIDLIDDEVRARAAQARAASPTPPPAPTATATAPGPGMAPEIQIPAEKPAPSAARRALDKVAEKVGYSRAAPAAPAAPAAAPEPTLSRAGSIRQAISGKNAATISDVGRKAKDIATSPRTTRAGAGLLRTGPVVAGLEGAHRGLNTSTDDYYTRGGFDREATVVPQVLKDLAVRGVGVLTDVGASAINTVMLPSNLLHHGLNVGDWSDYRDNYADVAAKKAGAPTTVVPAPAAPATGKITPPTEPIGDAPMSFAPAPTPAAAAAAPSTAEPQVAPGNLAALRAMGGSEPVRTLRGAGTQIIEGRDANGRKIFVGGHERSDAENEKLRQAEAERMKGVLAKQVDYFERSGIKSDLASANEFYQRRGLARQKAFDENARTDAAREIAAANNDLKRQEIDVHRDEVGVRREDLGLRRAQEARALAAAQFDREAKIMETQRKVTEDMDKNEEQVYKEYLPMFTTKGKDGQGNDIDVEDKAAHAAFINAARHTMAQRNIKHPVSGKPIGFGDLSKSERDRMYNRYNAVQRLKSTMGDFWWNADKADSLNLDDFDAEEKNGELVFPKLEAKFKGRKVRARVKDFEYADGASKWYDPFQTPDNTSKTNLLSKRGQ